MAFGKAIYLQFPYLHAMYSFTPRAILTDIKCLALTYHSPLTELLLCLMNRDCMSSQQLVDFIHERINMESSLSAVCERVLDRCLAPSTITGDGCDNMTMILVQFKKPVDRNKKAEVAGQSANNADEVKSRVAEE